MTIDLSSAPVFADMAEADRTAWVDSAARLQVAAGETIFREGDTPGMLYVLAGGRCMLSRDARPIGPAKHGDLLEPAAALGELPHLLRATAISDCDLLCWPLEDLWANATFSAAARRWLAGQLRASDERRDELESPVHYAGDSASLLPGPFVFNNTTLIFAFCDANLDAVRETLPPGLRLFRPAWRGRDSLLLALAAFRDAYPQARPDARFSYTETTYFAPVRFKGRFGLFPAYIYPSAWEPILLGREIYGFPKRLGQTTFTETSAALSVDGVPHFRLDYAAAEPSSEPRLIRALSDWAGFQGHMTEAAFRAGDLLLDMMLTPLQRRVSVFNHKRVPAATTTNREPAYSVDQLTGAIFSVNGWEQISRIETPALTMTGGPLAGADVTLREAYFTRLDMRLSTGRILRDYLGE